MKKQRIVEEQRTRKDKTIQQKSFRSSDAVVAIFRENMKEGTTMLRGQRGPKKVKLTIPKKTKLSIDPGLTLFELDFVHFSERFSQSFDLQSVTGSHNGVFKPIVGTSNRLQVKILQNSRPKNVQSRVEDSSVVSKKDPVVSKKRKKSNMEKTSKPTGVKKTSEETNSNSSFVPPLTFYMREDVPFSIKAGDVVAIKSDVSQYARYVLQEAGGRRYPSNLAQKMYFGEIIKIIGSTHIQLKILDKVRPETAKEFSFGTVASLISTRNKSKDVGGFQRKSITSIRQVVAVFQEKGGHKRGTTRQLGKRGDKKIELDIPEGFTLSIAE